MIDRRLVGRAAYQAVRGTLLACEPPTLSADSAAKRLADRLLPRDGWQQCLYFAGVIALWVLSLNLTGRPALAAAAAASFAAGAWCIVNFWRCRHAHCLVTGAGWLLLAGFAAAETVLGAGLISGFESVAFLGVLGAGMLFEFGCYVTSGTSVVGIAANESQRNGTRSPVDQDVISRS